MSLTQKVLALISGLDNPKARMDVASTINFLYDLFLDGRITEGQLKDDLYDICREVIAMSNPDLLEDEVRKRSAIVAEELVKTMKIEGLAKRTISRLGSSLRF